MQGFYDNYNIEILILKHQMNCYQTLIVNPAPQNRNCRVVSGSFEIQVCLSQGYLILGLKDFVDGIKYRKQYRQGDKKIQVLSLQDIFQSIRFSVNDQVRQKPSKNVQLCMDNYCGFLDADLNQKVIHNGIDCFKVQKNGKITVYLNVNDKRTNKNRVFETVLLLEQSSKMSETAMTIEKYKLSNIINQYSILKQKQQQKKQKDELQKRLGIMQNNFQVLKQRQSLLQSYIFKEKEGEINKQTCLSKLKQLEKYTENSNKIYKQISLAAQWDLYVYPSSTGNIAKIYGRQFKCSIGKNGATAFKKEGDGKTPVGTFPLREIWIRTDRVTKDNYDIAVNTGLPVRIINTYDGWCDEPKSQFYNKHVDLRTFDNKISHENLWRQDNLYDCFMVVGFNDSPVIPGVGSAIFIHIARQNYSGTAGCVAFSTPDLWSVISNIKAYSRITVYDQRNC